MDPKILTWVEKIKGNKLASAAALVSLVGGIVLANDTKLNRKDIDELSEDDKKDLKHRFEHSPFPVKAAVEALADYKPSEKDYAELEKRNLSKKTKFTFASEQTKIKVAMGAMFIGVGAAVYVAMGGKNITKKQFNDFMDSASKFGQDISGHHHH
jgi:hypothetical protein